MSIFVNRDTRLIVQGFTGGQGKFHSEQMIAYGTNLLGGVTPGKGGTTCLERPVFNTVREAREELGANTSVIFVPARAAAASIIEAAEAGIETIVCITEGIPVQDMIMVKHHIKDRNVRLIGPNCPGIITPLEAKVRIRPGNICQKGHVGVISRSGTLTYEAVDQLTKLGIGQSTAVGIGGDPIKGTDFTDCLDAFYDDPETLAIVLIGEIGGDGEERAAELIRKHPDVPVAGFIAGRTAPKGRRMGHAGAITSGNAGTAEGKISALAKAGVLMADTPDIIGETLRKVAEEKGILKDLL